MAEEQKRQELEATGQIAVDAMERILKQKFDDPELLALQAYIQSNQLEVLKQLDVRFERVDEKFEKIDKRFDKVDEKFDKFEQRIELRQDRNLFAILGFMIAWSGVLLAAFKLL